MKRTTKCRSIILKGAIFVAASNGMSTSDIPWCFAKLIGYHFCVILNNTINRNTLSSISTTLSVRLFYYVKLNIRVSSIVVFDPQLCWIQKSRLYIVRFMTIWHSFSQFRQHTRKPEIIQTLRYCSLADNRLNYYSWWS